MIFFFFVIVQHDLQLHEKRGHGLGHLGRNQLSLLLLICLLVLQPNSGTVVGSMCVLMAGGGSVCCLENTL